MDQLTLERPVASKPPALNQGQQEAADAFFQWRRPKSNSTSEDNMADKEVASQERRDAARQLFEQATGTGSAEGNRPDRSRWGSLWRFQKEAKKGWDVLGFTPKEIDRIKLNKPDWV